MPSSIPFQRTPRTFLIVLVCTLVVFGLIMLYSTSYATAGDRNLRMQAMWIVSAFAAAGIMRQVDYHLLCRYSIFILFFFVLLLGYLAFAHLVHKVSPGLAAHLPFTGGVKGAFRWYKFGPIRLQPSEFTKLGIILFLADYYGKNNRFALETWRGFLLPVGIAGGATGLILLGGSLSVTVITGLMVLGIAFTAGIRLRYLMGLMFGGLMTVLGVICVSPERFSRLTSFMNPELVQQGDGYQLWHSILALGSGGWTGLGFTESRMKKFYLPEAHTDFILSIVGEELGFLAVLLVLITFLLLTFTLLHMAARAADREGSLICTGIALAIGLHVFVNLGVVSGFLPTTGVTAPFISYGGSSILAFGIGLGMVLSVSRHADRVLAEQLAQEHGNQVRPPAVPDKLFH